MPAEKDLRKITVSLLQAKKQRRQKISMLTAYDYPMAQLQDEAGIDIVFVGDSLGTNVLGYRSPQQVTMEDILHHLRAVRRGVDHAFLLADLPFMAYQPSIETALLNVGRLVQEGGAEGIKLEGGSPVLPQVRAIADAGVPIMGHLGFTPQYQMRDSYLFSERRGTVPKFQGKGPKGAQILLDEALRLEDAGVFGLVLELVTEEVAQIIAERLQVPVIGIGAGRYCDGQVLVLNDLIGLSSIDLTLAKPYANLRDSLADAFRRYREDVEALRFPTEENAMHMQKDKLEKLRGLLQRNGENN
jgi:3-methyl-2-oxobutanoate hydroxymethyltransferase